MWCAHRPHGVSCTPPPCAHSPACTLTRAHSPPSHPHCVFEQLGRCKHNHLNTPTPPGADSWSMPPRLCGDVLLLKCVRPGQPLLVRNPYSATSGQRGSLTRILGSLPVSQPQLPGPARPCVNTRSGKSGLEYNKRIGERVQTSAFRPFFPALSEIQCPQL